MKKIFIYLLLATFSLPSYGEEASTNKGSKGADSGTASVGGPSSNQASNNAQGANKSGQVMSMLMGGMFMAEGASHVPGCSSGNGGDCVMAAIMFGMGAMSFAQGGEHGSKAGQAGLTASMTDGFDFSQGGGLTDADLSKYPEIKSGLDAMKKFKPGTNPKFSYDPKTGKIVADGKEYNASDFASGGAMANAGLPPGAIEGALDYAAQLEKKAAEKVKLGAFTAANGYEEGGGGGAGGGVTVVEESTDLSSQSPGGGGLGAAGERTANMAGMTKDYNGDPIGVAADSIFDMMTRRYNVKKQQDTFFSETEVLLNK